MHLIIYSNSTLLWRVWQSLGHSWLPPECLSQHLSERGVSNEEQGRREWSQHHHCSVGGINTSQCGHK